MTSEKYTAKKSHVATAAMFEATRGAMLGALVTVAMVAVGCAKQSTSRDVSSDDAEDSENFESAQANRDSVVEPVATDGAYLTESFANYSISNQTNGTVVITAPSGSAAKKNNSKLDGIPIGVLVLAGEQVAKLQDAKSEYTRLQTLAVAHSSTNAEGGFKVEVKAFPNSFLLFQISTGQNVVRIADMGGGKAVSVVFDGEDPKKFYPLLPSRLALDVPKIWRKVSATLLSQDNPLFKRVAVGKTGAAVITSTGTIAAWGVNMALANSSATYVGVMPSHQNQQFYVTPMSDAIVVQDPSNGNRGTPAVFVSIVAGEDFACALEGITASVYCWGSNLKGQLGLPVVDGTDSSTSHPAKIPSLTQVVHLAAGASHACAVKASGELICWGNNTAAEAGTMHPEWTGNVTGGTPRTPNPIPKPSTLSPRESDEFKYVQVTAGQGFTCALGSDQKAYCFGARKSGEIGTNTIAESVAAPASPIRIIGSNQDHEVGLFSRISAGPHHMCGIGVNQTVYCWGAQDYAKTGNVAGSQVYAYVGNSVMGTMRDSGSRPIDLALTTDVSCVLYNNGNAYCFGRANRNVAGCGSTCGMEGHTFLPGPVQVNSPVGPPPGNLQTAARDIFMTSIAGSMAAADPMMGFVATYATGSFASWGWKEQLPYPGTGSVPLNQDLLNKTLWNQFLQ